MNTASVDLSMDNLEVENMASQHSQNTGSNVVL